MRPEYTNEPFHVGDNPHYERVCVPAEVWGTLERFAVEEQIVGDSAELVEGKWWVRLSAPGYMDCTDWDGPFDSKAEARKHVEEFWEVDPDNGAELGDE